MTKRRLIESNGEQVQLIIDRKPSCSKYSVILCERLRIPKKINTNRVSYLKSNSAKQNRLIKLLRFNWRFTVFIKFRNKLTLTYARVLVLALNKISQTKILWDKSLLPLGTLPIGTPRPNKVHPCCHFSRHSLLASRRCSWTTSEVSRCPPDDSSPPHDARRQNRKCFTKVTYFDRT